MKRLILIILAISVLFLTSCGSTKENERLTVSQIEALREEYPVCGKKLHPLIDMAETDFEDSLKRAETFVYCEITGNATYSENAYGEFFEYPVTVIYDTEKLYKKGETFTLYANKYFEEYNPSFRKGMKAIVPVITPKNNPSKKSYGVIGSYYVTPEGFAISAFDEEKLSEEKLSGLKADAVMKRIRILRR